MIFLERRFSPIRVFGEPFADDSNWHFWPGRLQIATFLTFKQTSL